MVIILFFSFSDTYESALKAEKEAVASSESEIEVRQMGKRKIKSNKFKDYVDDVGPPRLVLSRNSDKSGRTTY